MLLAICSAGDKANEMGVEIYWEVCQGSANFSSVVPVAAIVLGIEMRRLMAGDLDSKKEKVEAATFLSLGPSSGGSLQPELPGRLFKR